jgi:hypothetical protein
LEHVIDSETLAVAPGLVLFSLTITDPLAVDAGAIVAVTLYVPAAETVGYCCVEVKPFGPFQAYVAPL